MVSGLPAYLKWLLREWYINMGSAASLIHQLPERKGLKEKGKMDSYSVHDDNNFMWSHEEDSNLNLMYIIKTSSSFIF